MPSSLRRSRRVHDRDRHLRAVGRGRPQPFASRTARGRTRPPAGASRAWPRAVVEVVVVRRRRRRPTTCTRSRTIVASYSGFAPSPDRVHGSSGGDHVVVDDGAVVAEVRAPAAARARRRARRRRDGRRTRRRRRGGRPSRCASTSSSARAPGGRMACDHRAAKFSAPSALVSTKSRSPAGPTWGSTWYSWPCTRGSTTRGSAATSSASTSRTSVVTFDADVITSTRPVRARSTDTKNRSSSSWKTSTSSRPSCRACAATPATGASPRRDGCRARCASSFAHATP